MRTINRSLAIIIPKQPFVDWANQLPDADFKVSLDDLQEDCLAILIPEYDTKDEAKAYIDELSEDLFEELLFDWCTEEAWLPQERTKELFWQWFEVALHSVVIDPCENPIKKDE
ncbi:MAG: hypothetical protein L0209_01665 [candidate division Zixibacteria bacterium]|nr:hypothetical protein [candidate division Zixibacteria bacterium]